MVHRVFNDDRICALVCFCCAQIYTSWIGKDIVRMNFAARKTPIAMTAGTYVIEGMIGTSDVRKLCFEDVVFKERYAQDDNSLTRESQLREDCWEWRRKLQYSNGMEVTVLCCPQDVQRSAACTHGEDTVCGQCAVPVCKKCGMRMMLETARGLYQKMPRVATPWARCPPAGAA